MNLSTLALVLLAGLAGPLLAASRRARVPIVVGEILLGVAVGHTGAGWVNADDPILSFVASAGFALVMLVAGSHVPLRDSALRVASGRGALLAAVVGVLSVPAGLGVAALVGTGHGLLYAVLLASSSAALVMPVIDEAKLGTPPVIAMIVQVAIADTACIVALPLAEDPARAGHAALGALAVIAAGAVWFLVLRRLHAEGLVERAHELSKTRHFGLELRVALIVLFGLAGLAQLVGVSVMLAGFVAGLALAAVGEPRRLAKQLFAVTDGFLGPVFFVWLGASLDLRALGRHPEMLALAALLAVGTVVVHGATRVLGQPLSLAVLAGAQLGVPVAAVTIGNREHLLAPGEGGAMLAAALVSVAVTGWAARSATRNSTQQRRSA
ncbi:cation:proton antiporter [Amycolatopsis sp. NPDC101161]|uniref:cation:proton antiporter n=1 Tax=Amycolatopsis sp. NPDC101161 TaxID=3363940 RepID=UPI0037FC4F2D